jgi:multiple sugar transport system permease protein
MALRIALTGRLRGHSLARREALTGYAFLSPWILGFLAFTLIPMIATLVFTFTNINLAQEEPIQFVGFRNYERLLEDPRVWQSIKVTVQYALLSLPVGIIVPFSVALLLNSRSLRGAPIFRVLFFMPYVVPFVAGVLIWSGMLNAETGWLNGALRFIGVENPPSWLNSPDTVYPALVLIGIWGIGAGIIINLAGLAGIPTELYDAAYIDGAGFWSSLRHVTLPLMTPVIFYTLTLGIVEVFQYFLVPLVINNGTGDPGGSTLFYNLYLYKQFFTFQNMSYGATLAWVLFLVILAVTVALFLTARRWVYYAGER